MFFGELIGQMWLDQVWESKTNIWIDKEYQVWPNIKNNKV